MRRKPAAPPLSMEIVHGEATAGEHSEIARRNATANDRVRQFSPVNFAVSQIARRLSSIDLDHRPTVVGIGRLETSFVWGNNKIDTDPTFRIARDSREDLFCKGMELVVRATRERAGPTGIGDGAVEVLHGMKSLFKCAERRKTRSVRGRITSD